MSDDRVNRGSGAARSTNTGRPVGPGPGATRTPRSPLAWLRRRGTAALRTTRRRAEERSPGLDTPMEARRSVLRTPSLDPEFFGRGSEAFARFMGTASFLFQMTMFVGIWLTWNTLAPAAWQFDPRALNYTLLTLILSLQASYAAPLILLAQNRQADRDRVTLEQDRQRSERNLADTEYLAREVAALRIALRDVATRDFVRSELRDLLDELIAARDPETPRERRRGKPGKGKQAKAAKDRTDGPAQAAATIGPTAPQLVTPAHGITATTHPNGITTMPNGASA